MCYTAQFPFLYDGLMVKMQKWLFTLENVSKNEWKFIIGREAGGGGGGWNKDVLGGKKIEKLTIEGGRLFGTRE